MIYTKADAEKLQSLITAPYLSVGLSTLGGAENASIMISLSLEPKDAWSYGYIENSRHARFMMDSGDVNKLEMFGGCYKLRSVWMRKSKVKSVEHAAQKIQVWVDANVTANA